MADQVSSSSHPHKRARVVGDAVQVASKAAAPSAPRIFAPFRALGFISNHVPFALQSRRGGRDATRPSVNVITCLGDSWAMWDADRITLLFVGPTLPAPISSLAVSPDSVLAVASTSVYRFVRGKQVARYDTAGATFPGANKRIAAALVDGESEDSDSDEAEESDGEDAMANGDGASAGEVQLGEMIVFGEQVLALAADGSKLFGWEMATGDLTVLLEMPAGFTAAHLLHPATYLNKVLLGSAEGGLALYNIRTSMLIHEFPADRLRPRTAPSAVTSLTQSPAVDVVAISYLDGQVLVYDVRADEEILSVSMEGGVGPGGVSFRTDGQAQMMATASLTGSIALWDLNAGARLVHTLRSAHDGAIARVEFAPGQPLLLSAGKDNALRQWFFESPNAPPRLLKQRSGHQAPPHLVRHYGDDGKNILTAARDRSLRCLSVVRDSRSFELSQGSLGKRSAQLGVAPSALKLPPATSLSFSTTRARDWDDVLSTHADEPSARSWTVRDKRISSAGMSGSREITGGAARAACVSACGNFGLVGSVQGGSVECYNMQSHIHRRTFDTRPQDPASAGKLVAGSKSRNAIAANNAQRASPVTGIATDALNKSCVVSTLDGRLSYFDFHSTAHVHTQALPAGIAALTLHRESGLMAATCDDLVVRLVDIETRRIVREFAGFRGRVLDVAFSPDARWLVTASLDSIIRTFDIPTGRLVDAFRTASIATSLSFSPTGDFLATSHVDSVGVYLWANKAQFTHVALRGLDDDEVALAESSAEVALPSVQGVAEDVALAGISDVGEPELQRAYVTPESLGEGLVTLSTMPRAKWQTLINLDVIKRRNKPKEAPKAPEKAPFFLPTLAGVEQRFAVDGQSGLGGSADGADGRRLMALGLGMDIESDFARRLRLADEEDNHNAFFAYLHTLSAPALDLELRQLVRLSDLARFLRILAARLRAHRDFEAVQALVAVFTRIHGDVIIANGVRATERENGIEKEGMDVESVNEKNGDEEEDEDEQGQELAEALRAVMLEQHNEGNRVMELLSYCVGTLSFVRNLPLS